MIVSVSLDIQKLQEAAPVAEYDVVVVGAGPYGLSAAAHLLAQGLRVSVFGKPLHFWKKHMPQGMLLRSYWWATDLSDPDGQYSFARYFQAIGVDPCNPLPADVFIDYGLWFQKQAVPEVDETYVLSIERKAELFLLHLADERVVVAKSVIMAPGLQYYAYYPSLYQDLPSRLVSHSSDHHELSDFADQRVAVIGGGQAALETAALLYENGASVELVSRRGINWTAQANSQVPSLLRDLRAPKAGMGCGWLNLLLEKYPYLFYYLPRDTRDHVLMTRHGPAGSYWLKTRVINHIHLHEHAHIENVTTINDRLGLSLTSGRNLEVDHVILGTGYHADIQRLPMLHPTLLASIQTYRGSPILNSQFESNIPGLFFIGYTAARNFGPFYRFVIGDGAAAKRVTRAVTGYLVHFR
ncbi:MAG TPA: NAD(P)-binding domain-containing protein [Ktedonobacteraceae bacterium]